MALTDVLIRSAKPREKRFKLSDSGGLYLEVSPTGGKWWRWKYRVGGTEKRLSFGTYPDVSLKAAREKHGAARQQLAAGVESGGFVGWYNGHPDYRNARIDLSARRVAGVGNGNVAVDVARILLRTRAELERTDIAAHALDALRESQVREVFLLGRRGPEQAAFTPAELKELGQLEAGDPVVDPRELAGCAAGEPGGNVEILRSFAARTPRPDARKLHVRFLLSPTEILADAAGGVAGIALERNRLEARPDGTPVARATGQIERLEVGMVLPAIGYAADRIPGVPFDEKAKVVANEDGRVVDPATRAVVRNEFVAGWARTGPQGLIGEHKRAFSTR